jgi:RNA polymerase sigma factor (sigma-70 family)
VNATSIDNSQLIALSVNGDHDAFRQIVERYQNLVCALAFSSCRNVAKSEDLTQETFLIAWQRLRELHEPGNLKAWLCGIVRNLARNSQRKRMPGQLSPAALESVIHEAVAPSSTPEELVVAREEAMVVEQALEAIPENYREPLILFYREDQSIQSVADAMDLSADAVRQRLSRGRNMLRDQVEAIIGRSLQRTKPTSALTIAIVTALPCVASQANAAVVAGGAVKAAPAVVKSFGLLSLLAAVASPMISLATVICFARWANQATSSSREKQYLTRYIWTVGFVIIISAVSISAISFDSSFMMSHPVWYAVLMAATIGFLLIGVSVLAIRADKRLKQIRAEGQQ